MGHTGWCALAMPQAAAHQRRHPQAARGAEGLLARPAWPASTRGSTPLLSIHLEHAMVAAFPKTTAVDSGLAWRLRGPLSHMHCLSSLAPKMTISSMTLRVGRCGSGTIKCLNCKRTIPYNGDPPGPGLCSDCATLDGVQEWLHVTCVAQQRVGQPLPLHHSPVSFTSQLQT